ncbi:NAD-dependent epimerase/dehydratase family protein [Spongiivirga citrea]|uniref:NAD-dependent epimerase/dehydratase family protein n=2 Tax=Spongiivirga citrea TaxID=1481457 RepID=A0A6M0CGC6_9FLAO|nr:NAD-dependent epimerase/dehydratase family protein [Spongiivirga citrea]
MILITGATGLVGSHLLAKLLLTKTKVRAIYRTEKKKLAVKNILAYYTDNVDALFDTIDWFQADITGVPKLAEAFNDINIVYHCAAIISFDEAEAKKLKKVNIEGTANVVNLCLSNKVSKLCYTSSIASLGVNENGEPITEETHWNPEAQNNIYSITKYGAELEVWRGSQEGLDTVIVNPGVILGSGFWRGGSGQLFRSVAKGLKYYTYGRVGFVDVKDVVEVMIDLTNSKISNERYILVAENRSFKEVFDLIAFHLKVKPTTKKAAGWMLHLAWRLDKTAHILFNKKRRFFKGSAISALQELEYDNQKIQAAIGYKFTHLEDTIAEVSEHYLIENVRD